MFEQIKKQVQQRFKELQQGNTKLFQVEVDRDKVWDIYLQAFPEKYRQENACNCCKSFIRQFAGIVTVRNNEMETLWDFDIDDEEYSASIKALNAYVKSLPINNIFLADSANCGTDKNPDKKRSLVWQHFYISVPNVYVDKDSGPKKANALDNKNVLQRSLNEITDDAVNTVLELIDQNSLYRGTEFKGIVESFQKVKIQYNKIKNNKHKDNFCWNASVSVGQAVTRIKNSAIGTLLNDLSEGRELDEAVKAFEKVVAPANYKRPTSLVTPRMVEQAKNRLVELGLTGCLNRRFLSDQDLNVNNAIFVNRLNNKDLDVFEQMSKDTLVNPKSLSKVEEVSILDFVNKIVPKSKSVKVLLENHHLGNFASLIGPKEQSENTLFKWNNNYSWSYSGQVADSIKERVKAAGGKVDGVLRVSLSWHNYDDLDLHLIEPNGYEIMFRNKCVLSPSGGMLDVDCNAGSGSTREPVENIFWKTLPKQEGDYKVVVNQWAKREFDNQGLEVEIEFEGEKYNYVVPDNGATGKNHNIVTFNYSKKNGLVLNGVSAKYLIKEKWGLKTGQFHTVRAITLSPNFWNGNIGNKHYFFFLEKCISDEKPRAFYNEFLKDELSKDRKVFEVLGSKVTVESSENELSGLGFSDTVRNHVFVEVDGTFKRILKVNF